MDWFLCSMYIFIASDDVQKNGEHGYAERKMLVPKDRNLSITRLSTSLDGYGCIAETQPCKKLDQGITIERLPHAKFVRCMLK